MAQLPFSGTLATTVWTECWDTASIDNGIEERSDLAFIWKNKFADKSPIIKANL